MVMKILMVNKFLYPKGGSETYILELGAQLEKMGHLVQYFGMEHPDRCVGNAVNAYTDNVDFHGGSVFSKLLAPFKIIYSYEARTKIRKVLDDFEPDAVHLNNINFQLTPSIIYEIRKWEKDGGKKCKIVFTAHDFQWLCPNHMLYIPQKGQVCERCLGGKYGECVRNNCIHNSKIRSIIGMLEAYYYKWRKTYNLVDAIICPSRFLYNKFADNPLLKDKLVMLRNFIKAPENGYDSEELAIERPYVLYFGRFDVQKGIKTLLQVCRELPEVNFVFAGTGPLEDEVNTIPNIKNVGFQKKEVLNGIIANALFSFCPSECYDNCPFSVMESQMLKTPVVGANIGGIPELIANGETGLLFEAGNKEELKKTILDLWNDKQRISVYSANCEKISFDDLDTYSKKIVECYKGNCQCVE